MPKPGTSANPPARCPRCAYDLSGHIAAWIDQCPTRGQCSECGLEFNWGDVLNATMRDLPWLYEHAPHWWSVRRAWSTAIRALAPWYFWKRVELHHRVRVGRLLFFLVISLMSLYAASILVGTGSAIALWIPHFGVQRPQLVQAWSAFGSSPVAQIDQDGVSLTISRGDVSTNLADVIDQRASPIYFETSIGPVLVVNDSNWDGWHVHRAESSTFRILGIHDVVWVRRMHAPDETAQPWDLIVVNVFRDRSMLPDPISESIVAAITEPIGIHLDSYTGPLGNSDFDWTGLNFSAVFMLGFLCAAVAIVLAAPSEWRHARVRLAHLLRISTYSLTPLVALFTLTFFAHVWAYVGNALWYFTKGQIRGGWWGYPEGWYAPPHWLATFATTTPSPGFLVLLAIWTPMYWWFALKRGMQLKRPIALWGFLTIGGFLGSVAIPLALSWTFVDWFM